MTHEALLIDGVRTPRGKGKPSGSLHPIHPQELLAQVLNALIQRTGIPAAEIDDVIVGNGNPEGDHANDIGRLAVLAAGWPVKVPGVVLNRFCGSGQQAAMFAAMGVAASWQRAVVAGGVESMSRYPAGVTSPTSAGNESLLERYPLVSQGISADLIASLEKFSRSDVDAFAVRSQQKAASALENGAFSHSVIPVRNDEGELVLDRDEATRPGTSMESLSALKPAFASLGNRDRPGESRTNDEACLSVYPGLAEIDHVHHAGNSSGVVDGASAMIIASPDFARAHGLKPRARIVSGAVVGADPVIMLTAPGPAATACLDKATMTVDDIDLWEINEAFAAVPMKVIRDLSIDEDRVNVNGGAIALGHPIGATGPMLFQTVLDELERRDLSTGLITMCTGGGMGTATIIERL
ncbi:acetyl-CoA C-acetyltransferase [Gordonia sp. zg691]|uniref:acetyl-CoA C-acetyltransferase n=1 Tax=Gordonia jinghuaiqii TaxID=2758710 RepID=UPI00166272DC|nr:acetyl-CoA C-acetyltransferase [Gordonia jinghuaiqii]MBD0859787.1 acetyl-CoA C-acetyltransferase [Gordonia jinghuaiqii]